MAYVDLNTIHNPSTGGVAPAAWGDQVRDNLEFLIDPPSCSIFNSAAVSTTNLTNMFHAADSENFDNDAMHSTVSNTSRITIQTAGRYLFLSSVTWAANTTGERRLQFAKNGVALVPTIVAVTANTSGSQPSGLVNVTAQSMLAGDYMEVISRQGSGGALNATLQEFSATFLTR